MGTQNLGHFRPVRASLDMSVAGYRYRAVSLTTTGTLARTAAGARSLGLLSDAPKSGEAGSVQVRGQGAWEAGAAFNAGVELTADANGKAVAATPGDYVLAVSSEASSGDGHIVAVEIQPSTPLSPTYLQLDIADGSLDATYYLVAPFAGTITKLRSVIDGVVSTADITITPNIGATPITNGLITISLAGTVAGDVDVATPTAANAVTAGQAINFVVAGGGAGGAPRIHLVVELTP
jgi:hypothetical protein